MDLAADRPGDLGQPALDRHVDVLVVGQELEGAVLELGRDLRRGRCRSCVRLLGRRGSRPRRASPRAPATGARRRRRGAGRSAIDAFSAWKTGSGGSRKRPMTGSLRRAPPATSCPAIAPIWSEQHRRPAGRGSRPSRRARRGCAGTGGCPACGRSRSRPASTRDQPGRDQREAARARQQPVEAAARRCSATVAEQVVEEDHRDGGGGDQPGEADQALAAG